nr:hypothetical protein [Labrys monachus]
MVQHHVEHARVEGRFDRLQGRPAVTRMSAHDLELGFRQPSRLGQDPLGHAELADVVQQPTQRQLLDVRREKPE